MSTRLPPGRGRGTPRPTYQPPAPKAAQRADTAPKGAKKSFPFVIVLVAVALVIVFIQVGTSGALPAGNPGATLGLGKTPKPGNNSPATTGAPVPVTDRPVITEVMTTNSGSVTTAAGAYTDWIELYNPTGRSINLSGFALSDNLKKPTKSLLPSYVLEPGKYVLVYADGGDSTKDELHVSFKLKSSGQPVILVDPNGSEAQTLTTPEMQTNTSYALDMGDMKTWAATPEYTPGFANTKEGRAAYLETRRAVAPVSINEVMAGNTLTFQDEDGDYSDWVELYNSSDQEVDLTGWGLSNRETEPKRWEIPAVKLAPKQYLLVFVSGKNRADAGKELHTDFRLNGFKDTILLSNLRGQIVSQISINDLKADASFGLVPNTDKWQVFTHPTPGEANTEDGFNALQPKLFAGAKLGDVVISEVMSNNVETLKDQFDEYPDWIELYNRSGKDVNLKGWGLTDKPNELGRWKLPDITLKAGQYYTVFASGRNLTDPKKKLHTDFSIGSDGDIIVLTKPDGAIADRCLAPSLRAGITYGRPQGKDSFVYLDNPTPNAANPDGYPGFAPDPVFSLKAGIYQTDQTLTILSSDPNEKIYFTLDGDRPTTHSTEYGAPIDLKKRSDKVDGRSITGATVVRAISYKDGYLPSSVSSATYLIGNDITLPVLSIAVDNDPMFNPTTGLYMKGPSAESKYPYHGANFFKDTELPAHLELMEADGTVGLSQDIGLRMFGQYSRGEPLKGLALIARSKYGNNSLDYQIFPDQPYTSYKSVVLKPGGQDTMRTGMRDVLAASLARDVITNDESGGPSVYVQNYRTAVLFVNGQFWGVTQIREKVNTQTIAQHYNVDENKLDILEGTGSIVKAGSSKDFKAMVDYAKNHDLSNKENYDHIAAQMDIDSYIDWFTMEINTGNSDMANIRMWRAQLPDGSYTKWRWIFYDFCWGFNSPDRSDIQLDITGNKTGASTNRALVQALLKNDGFKKKFLERLAYHINVTFSTDTMLQRIDQIASDMKPYMDDEFWKWKGLAEKNWNGQVETLRKYARQHPERLKQQMKSFFHLSDAEMQQYFGS